jgi:hypothetical protein
MKIWDFYASVYPFNDVFLELHHQGYDLFLLLAAFYPLLPGLEMKVSIRASFCFLFISNYSFIHSTRIEGWCGAQQRGKGIILL